VVAGAEGAGGVMGWNDHVEFIETQCLDCGEVDDWEYWDCVGRERYVGAVGKLLNVDATRSGKCPHCRSSRGQVVEE
jgi:hypothetical protein